MMMRDVCELLKTNKFALETPVYVLVLLEIGRSMGGNIRAVTDIRNSDRLSGEMLGKFGKF